MNPLVANFDSLRYHVISCRHNSAAENNKFSLDFLETIFKYQMNETDCLCLDFLVRDASIRNHISETT